MAETIERLAVLIEANTKSYERAMLRLEQRTQQAMRKSTAAVSSLDGQLKSLTAGFAKFASGAAIGAGIALLSQIPKIVGDIVSEASDLVNAADRIGITTDRLQELHHAASLADVEVGDLDKSMEQFSKRIGQALTGTGNLKDILEANNVSLRDQYGNVRSVNDLLLDYADLMKNAGSEQEKLYLATEAFGRSGMDMVNVLDNGSAGLRNAAAEAQNLGKVLDEDLLREVEQIGDEWTNFVTSLEVRFKQFVLGVVSGASDVSDAIRHMANPNEALTNLARETGALAKAPEITVSGGDRGKARPTIVPVKEDREQDKIDDLIESLKLQEEQLGRTDREQAIYNNLARAGVDLNSEAGGAIAALTGKIYDQQVAIEAANEASMFFGEQITSALSDLIMKGGDAKDVLRSLVSSLAEAALQATLLGQGPLAGIFGTAAATAGAPGGILGSLLGGLFGGFRAAGGPVSAGRSYVVGEKGPELFIPNTSGMISPNGRGGGPSVVEVHIVEGQMFEPRVEVISGNVSAKVFRTGTGMNERAKMRAQQLGG